MSLPFLFKKVIRFHISKFKGTEGLIETSLPHCVSATQLPPWGKLVWSVSGVSLQRCFRQVQWNM